MEYTLESIEERLSAAVSGLEGYRYNSVNLYFSKSLSRGFYSVSLHFNINGMMRGPVGVTGDTLQEAVDTAFIELGSIAGNIKTKPTIQLTTERTGKKRGPKQQTEDSKAA